MKRKIVLFVLVLLSLFLIACNKEKEEPVDPDLYFNVTNQTITIYKDETAKIEYETNIEGFELVSEDDSIVGVKNDIVYGKGLGMSVVDVMYKGNVYAEIYVIVEKKPVVIIKHILTIDGDEYEVRDQTILGLNIKEYFGGVMYISYDDMKFDGWYLDPEFNRPANLEMGVTSDMSIYSKYKKIEIESDLRINIENVVGYKGSFDKNADVQTISPAFGTYAKFASVSLGNYALVKVEYDASKMDYFVTEVLTDGTKEDTLIPVQGFIVCIKKDCEGYDEYLDNLTVGAKITLGRYSVNVSNVLFVNETVDEFTNYFEYTGYLSCDYACAYDVRNKTIIYSKNGDSKTYPASTTKIITAIAAIKYCSLDDTYVVGDDLDLCYQGSDPSVAGLKKGQVWSLRQLLYATLLPSGNDAAYGLAALTMKKLYPDTTWTMRQQIDKFAEIMNEVAREAGATNCNFMVPDGNSYYNNGAWDDRMTYQNVTANDMAKIGAYALTFPAIAEVVSTPSVSLQIVSKESFSFTNTNNLIRSTTSYYYEGAVGIKTGTTNPAGACLVSAVEINRRLIVVACLHNSASSGRYTNSIALYNAIFGKQ